MTVASEINHFLSGISYAQKSYILSTQVCEVSKFPAEGNRNQEIENML